MSTFAQKCTVILVTAREPDEQLAVSLHTIIDEVTGLVLESVTAHRVLSTLPPSPVLLLLYLGQSGDTRVIAPLLSRLAVADKPSPMVVLAEPGLAEEALPLLRRGAVDYLERPLDLRRLSMLIEVLTVRARQTRATPSNTLDTPTQTNTFIDSADSRMGRVLELASRVATVDSNILIRGETGTGKTRLAKIIHEFSARKNRPFFVVNCAALSPMLIESEMFGHVKGAFTGADRNRTGKFAEVGSGTIFLDEVDSLSPALQAKLLRVIGERVFEKVGSNTPIPMQARLIAATNRSLEAEIACGRFRADLYYRLNVVTIEVPPLRERPELFDALLNHFFHEMILQSQRKITGIAQEAIQALRAYHWPGNIRELRNAIERAVALRPTGRIELEDLPDVVMNTSGMNETCLTAALTETTELPALGSSLQPQPSRNLSATKAEAEATLIRSVLQKHRNNRSRTAAELGISRETLYKKLHRYQLYEG